MVHSAEQSIQAFLFPSFCCRCAGVVTGAGGGGADGLRGSQVARQPSWSAETSQYNLILSLRS